MKRVIIKVLEAIMPERCAKVREQIKARDAAMQTMLDMSRKLRYEHGVGTDDINHRLKPALISYKCGRFEQASDYATSAIFTCIAI